MLEGAGPWLSPRMGHRLDSAVHPGGLCREGGMGRTLLMLQANKGSALSCCRFRFHQLPAHLHVPHALGDDGGQRHKQLQQQPLGVLRLEAREREGTRAGEGTGERQRPHADH